MDPLHCDMCENICPNTRSYKKAYFSTTQYGGILCSTGCCISYMIRCRKNKIKTNKKLDYEGDIKIIHTRGYVNRK